MKTTSTAKYPLSMIVFHALIAVLMIATLVVGWQLEDNSSLMGLHKSLGVSVLVFAVLRLVNRMANLGKTPDSVNAKGSLNRIVEKSVHGLLYICMLAIPVVGWLTSNAFGYPASFFGLFSLPTLIAKNTDLAETLGHYHGFGANVFAVLLGLHLLGGLVHWVAQKQNIFKRMMP